jgi:hypothetical protein
MKTLTAVALGVSLSLTLLSFGWWSSHSVSAATSDIPPGVVKGATLTTVSLARQTNETFEVEEVRGTWVRAKAVKTLVWMPKYEGVWLNLATIDQFAIDPPPSPGK